MLDTVHYCELKPTLYEQCRVVSGVQLSLGEMLGSVRPRSALARTASAGVGGAPCVLLLRVNLSSFPLGGEGVCAVAAAALRAAGWLSLRCRACGLTPRVPLREHEWNRGESRHGAPPFLSSQGNVTPSSGARFRHSHGIAAPLVWGGWLRGTPTLRKRACSAR